MWFLERNFKPNRNAVSLFWKSKTEVFPEVGVVTLDIRKRQEIRKWLSFSKSVTYKDAVGYFITRSQFLHAVYLHGAEIPADFCANASESHHWS